LHKYGELTVFKTVAVHHLGFLQFKFLNNRSGDKSVLHRRKKFRKDWSNCCADIAIFMIFKMAAAVILDFQKFEILTVDPLYGAIVRHRVKFHHQNPSNRCIYIYIAI